MSGIRVKRSMGGQPETLPNRRKHDRLRTKLLGRYLLADHRENRCTIVDVSISGVALRAPERGSVGETVILYIDQIGRVEGRIARLLEDGFAVELAGSAQTTITLANRLTALQTQSLPSDERRREPRIDMRGGESGQSFFEGTECEVINLSLTGAEVKLQGGHRPSIGSVIQVGSLRGKVIRHTEAGIAIEFTNVPDTLTLTDRLNEIALTRSLAAA
jgi:hypothetical protein